MHRRLAAAGLTLALLAAACSSADDRTVTTARADEAVGADPTPARESRSGAEEGEAGDDRSAGDEVAIGREPTAARTDDGLAAGLEVDAVASSPDPSPPPVSTDLAAGWVDDNERFADYLDFLAAGAVDGVTMVDVTGRQVIRVVDGAGEPVAGALVTLRTGGQVAHRARTHADGRVLAFPSSASTDDIADEQRRRPRYTADVTHNGTTITVELDPSTDDHELTVAGGRRPVTALDVLFLIDATGSMSDEIDRLKANMDSVAAEISAQHAQLDLRFAMVSYRDHGDEYVTRTTDFTPDLSDFQQELDAVVADGGGDNPEAVDEALHEAVEGVSWRTGEAIGLVFLVADAPPHLDDPQNSFDYADAALAANEAGLKIFPVASSGLDPAGEYVFRQVAQLTGAPFVFLTYGADGSPGTERPEFAVDDYSVLALDQLIVRLVTEQIAHQLGG